MAGGAHRNQPARPDGTRDPLASAILLQHGIVVDSHRDEGEGGGTAADGGDVEMQQQQVGGIITAEGLAVTKAQEAEVWGRYAADGKEAKEVKEGRMWDNDQLQKAANHQVGAPPSAYPLCSHPSLAPPSLSPQC